MDKSAKYAELIRLQKGSGLTVREFCRNEGLAPSTFYYWYKKLRRDGTGRNNFIPLIVNPDNPPQDYPITGNNNTSSGSGQMANNNNILLELVYPNGTILRINKNLDLAQIRTLVHLND